MRGDQTGFPAMLGRTILLIRDRPEYPDPFAAEEAEATHANSRYPILTRTTRFSSVLREESLRVCFPYPISSKVYDRGHPPARNLVAAEEPFPEPFHIPIEDVLDLHTVPPRDVKAVVEEYLIEAN